MEYNFRGIEKKWQLEWKDAGVYKVSNTSDKPKFYVLDMFPYPSGAGLHVGHPLGYIASDIYARYKRLKGFNVLHPMGYDSFGLPAEQYALETGQHPAVTTKNNIKAFREQLDNIGFCFDWSREVRTSDPKYYKWTQWIFLQLFNSYFCNTQKKARPISELIVKYETKGCSHFTAEEWKAFSEKEKSEWLMKRRLAFSAYGEVNWCEALGTVLANDEVINGVSERGGHPVVKKKMRQWYLRITAYAERLLQGLETVEFSDAMKEMQRNWIGKSEGAEMDFSIAAESLTSNPSPSGEGNRTPIQTGNTSIWPQLKDLSRENRKEKTLAEDILWQRLRSNQLGAKVRRQHVIGTFIIDFAFLNEKLLIEIDGEYHNDPEQKIYDESRTEYLAEAGYKLIRFANEEVKINISSVLKKIKDELTASAPLSRGRGDGGEAFSLKVYTTRSDTIFGVDFMVLAPEHELVEKITTDEQRASIGEYLHYVKSRSERERMAEVKQVTGAFTGAYAINPFDGRKIPIWIAEYVLAGYGTGAIMAVPCGDQRDFDFAKHFNIPVTNIIGEYFNGQEANPTKEATLTNSDFLNGIKMKDAIDIVLKKIEEEGIGKRKVNYKMRDAGFSRQRYWGEPFPIVYHNGIAYPLSEDELPVELPHVENYKPGPEGEGPLANITEWVNLAADDVQLESNLTPVPSPKERGEEPTSFVTSDFESWKTLKPFARENRKNKTPAENLLWQNIRNRKVADAKFRRQHAIGGFIVDFVCLESTLVIEIDGDYHEDIEQRKYDSLRTEYLKDNGFDEIRFTNDEIVNNISEVLTKIKTTLRQSSPLPGRGVRGEVSYKRETNTMPGYAGSSWYFLRYMDPHNDEEFADRKATDYWNQVDVYIGGTEHAVGHLLYSRMWTKVLYDLGLIGFDEPYKKLVNQGMITGKSYFIHLVNTYRDDSKKNIHVFCSINKGVFLDNIEIEGQKYHSKGSSVHFRMKNSHNIIDSKNRITESELVKILNSDNLVIDEYKILWEKDRTEDGHRYIICEMEIEKMSKSKYNVDNPEDIIDKYGADTFRMYEMFLGPVEQSKPWDTKGIEGVHRFLKKLWRLFYDDIKGKVWTSTAPSLPIAIGTERAGGEVNDAELKILHKAIKKIEEDTERFSYNTAVSAFMVCVNELTDIKCHKKEILEPLLILLTPYAPHIAEELYHALGNTTTILDASYPKLESKYLIESEKEYPVSINGKMRTTINISLDASQDEVEKIALNNEIVQKWMEGKTPRKIIFVKNKMINVVV